MGWIRWLQRISYLCAELSGWLVIPMMLSIFLDALLRGVFNIALMGVVESNSLLLVTLIYMGIAGAQASGANFRLTLFTERVRPALRHAFNLLSWLLMIGVLGIFWWFALQSALFSYARGESSYGLVSFPLWPSRFVVAFGLGLLWLQLFADGLLLITRRIDPFARDAGHSDEFVLPAKEHS